MTNVTESRRFEQLLTQCGATSEGAAWVKTAVDPFHDLDLDIVGMPDSTSGRSVIYAVTSNLSITKPAGLGVNDVWDSHIAFTPQINDTKLTPFPAIAKEGTTQALPSVAAPDCLTTIAAEDERINTFLTANSVASGEPTFFNPQDAATANATCEYTGLGLNKFLDQDGSSIVRITGAAFEVHNTTEDVYKSGSVTSYKVAREADPSIFEWRKVYEAHTYRLDMPATITNGPPTSASVAKLYNGHTWDAADGCLIPGVLDAGESDGEKAVPRLHVVKCTRDNSGDVQADDIVYWAPSEQWTAPSGVTSSYARGGFVRSATGELHNPYNLDGAIADGKFNCPPTVVPEMMTSGAYFTGLSPQTKLTLTLRVFVEVFPAAGNPLVPLAHPSNPYDAKALQCYQEIMSHMRSGYRVNDNDFGDYFKKAIHAARTVGKIVTPMLPPGMRQLAQTADAVAAKAEEALTTAQKIEKAMADSRKPSRGKVRNRARGKGAALG